MSQSQDSEDKKLFAYIKAFVVPTLILKGAIIYFGLNYSMYPDEGYGWGLLAAVVLSLFNFALFLWKNATDSSESETEPVSDPKSD